jgi:hypothetical protein
MDWSWTIVASVLVTYVHTFNNLAERYLDGRVVSWMDLLRTTTSNMDREQWLSVVRG